MHVQIASKRTKSAGQNLADFAELRTTPSPVIYFEVFKILGTLF